MSRAEGAETILTAGTYDEAVVLAAASCAGATDHVLVQDKSWPGYNEIPRHIVDGYHTLFAESTTNSKSWHRRCWWCRLVSARQPSR